MKVKKRKKPKKTRLHIAVKIHTVITMFVFVAYVCSGVLLGPDLLMRDLKNKYALAASSVSLSLWIPGPPEVPVLSGYEQCDKGNLAIWLSWTASPDATNYDVYRDGELLISGISTSYYTDIDVQQNSAYAYYIVAYGPLGNAQSNEIIVSTGICEPPPPPQPQCSIISFDGIDLTQHSGSVSTVNKTPFITGITNIPDAKILIQIYPGPIVTANTIANINGYWSWTVPTELPLGAYVFYVTAIDPNDKSRSSSASLSFVIIEKVIKDDDDEDGKDDSDIEVTRIIIPQGRLTTPLSRERNQEKVLVEVKNKNKIVFRGQDLFLDVVLREMGDRGVEHKGWFTYRIFDLKSKLLYEIKEERNFFSDDWFEKEIKLPVFINPGKYKVSLFVIDGDKVIGAEDYFSVRDFAIMNLGGGILLTNEMLIANLGWALLILLLILLLFLILLWIEHRLYMHASRNVFDVDLGINGYIGKRKEVER